MLDFHEEEFFFVKFVIFEACMKMKIQFSVIMKFLEKIEQYRYPYFESREFFLRIFSDEEFQKNFKEKILKNIEINQDLTSVFNRDQTLMKNIIDMIVDVIIFRKNHQLIPYIVLKKMKFDKEKMNQLKIDIKSVSQNQNIPEWFVQDFDMKFEKL